MSNVIEKVMYKCPECGQAYDEYNRATRCAFKHARETAINADFETGDYTLENIWYQYGIQKELPQEMKAITSTSCFVVSYLQCCDEPAYQITHISVDGDITIGGDGSWNGYYQSKVGYHNLMNPKPESELWKYREKGLFGKDKKVALTNTTEEG